MTKKSGYVGIMVANHNQRKYVLRQYLVYNTSNVKLFCFTPSAIDWERKRIIGLHRSNGKWLVSSFPFPDVVYNRCYEKDHSIIDRLEAVIGKNKCFNHLNQFNKHEMHQNLNPWLDPYLPETVPYDMENAARLLEKHKLLYLKPCYGNRGKGVYRVEKKASGEIHIGHHHFLPKTIVRETGQFQDKLQQLLGSTPYIIQEGVHIKQLSDQNFDIRVLVQKNKHGLWSVTNVVSRIAHKGYFNTSVCEKVCLSEEALNRLYPADEVNAIMQSIYDISLRAAEIIEIHSSYHLGELSVDLAIDNEGHIWIIEVNGKPQKDLYKAIHKRHRVYKRPLQYADYLCKRRSML